MNRGVGRHRPLDASCLINKRQQLVRYGRTLRHTVINDHAYIASCLFSWRSVPVVCVVASFSFPLCEAGRAFAVVLLVHGHFGVGHGLENGLSWGDSLARIIRDRGGWWGKGRWLHGG